jgi:hypothetical protein
MKALTIISNLTPGIAIVNGMHRVELEYNSRNSDYPHMGPRRMLISTIRGMQKFGALLGPEQNDWTNF